MPKQRSLAIRLKDAKAKSMILDFEKRIQDLKVKKRELLDRSGRSR